MAMSAKGKKYIKVIAPVMIISLIGAITYVIAGLLGFGNLELMGYIPIFMSVLMYVSIIKYVISYYKEGGKASISSMMMRYCMMTSVTLLSFREGNDVQFMVTMVIIILVPFISGDLAQMGRNKKLEILVLVLVAVDTVLKFVAPEYVPLSISGGLVHDYIACFDNLNLLLQWAMFMGLYFARCHEYKQLAASAAAKGISIEEALAAEGGPVTEKTLVDKSDEA